jgi:hypothetical protein
MVVIEELEDNTYKINITNTNNYDLKDYQIKIPTDNINILDKNVSLKLYSGELVAWVKVPQLYTNQDLDLYIYYGNKSFEFFIFSPVDSSDLDFTSPPSLSCSLFVQFEIGSSTCTDKPKSIILDTLPLHVL